MAIFTYLLCLLLSGWPSGEQRAELHRLRQDALVQRAIQNWKPLLSDPNLDVQELGRVRRHITVQEMNIQLFEGLLKEFPNDFSPSTIRQWQQEVVKGRAIMEKAKKYEKVLEWAWEQRRLKPGSETERMVNERILKAQEEVLDRSPNRAPMPREVKPTTP